MSKTKKPGESPENPLIKISPHTSNFPEANRPVVIKSSDLSRKSSRALKKGDHHCESDNESLLHMIMDEMLDVVFCTDTTGIIHYCSPSSKSIIGYDSDFLIGQSIFDFVHPRDLDNVMGIFNFGLRSCSTTRMIFHFRHAKANYIFLETIGNMLHDDQGLASGFVFCSRDISHRFMNDRMLRFSRDKFAKAFLCNPGPITITTLEEGRYMEVNDAFLNTFGYERYEVIGNTSLELGTWLDASLRDQILIQIRNNGSIHEAQLKMRLKNGENRTVLLSLETIDMDDQILLLSMINDITDRIRMEEALRLSEECFAKAFNASPVTMCLSTLTEGCFIKVNDSFCCLTGHKRDEIVGQTSFKIELWADIEECQNIVRQILNIGAVRNMDAHLVTKSGQVRTGLISAERLIIDDKICMLSTFTDITEKRQMENEINRLDRLNLIGQMAASIGHEIRNPMTTVRGFLQVLKHNDAYQEDNETFELMIEELDRANSIITEFLSLAKNKLIKPEVRSLNTLISNIHPLLQAKAMAEDKNIMVKLGIIPDLLLDEKEIRQLLFNLVNNGLEAMSSGGTLTIRTGFKENKVVLSIEDQGNGMPEEVLDQLGTPFFTTKEEGTGLGLAVCYGIVNRHNASIEVDTTPRGTVFRVLFSLSR